MCDYFYDSVLNKNNVVSYHFLLLFPCNFFFPQPDIVYFEEFFSPDRPTRFCGQEIRKPRKK